MSKTYTDWNEFWAAAEREREATRERGGDLIPLDMLDKMQECCRLRGLRVRFAHKDGDACAVATILDEHGIPIPEHGGPPNRQ